MDLNILLKHTSRSLYLSAKILPTSMRPAFSLAYLLCRYADTIADTHLIPAEKRLKAIRHFAQAIRDRQISFYQELAKNIQGKSDNPYESTLLSHLPDCLTALDKIDPALLPYIYEVVQAVCAGMDIDLSTFSSTEKPRPFNTIGELKHYCNLMGGKPGLFWSQLIFHTHHIKLDRETFYQAGQSIGDALQIVNVLRDLPKDLQYGRCYFPQEQLQAYSLTPNDLSSSQNSARFEPIKIYWIRWGKENLQQAISYFNALPKMAWRTRAAVAWPILWTADTFYKLAAAPDLLDKTKRIKISRRRIYATLVVTPFILVSNTLFAKWLTHKLNKLS